jgi:hypothetical protein
MKTGAPAVIFMVLPATGATYIKMKINTSTINFPCMESNFKTLMINIMTFNKKSV